MRLLNTQTLEFEEFSGEVHHGIPPYAILSHTWGAEEVSYQDHLSGISSSKKGWEKVLESARVADSEGFRYVWADTCCIDKSSSAELSEAINSMFQWYRDAAVCYAYINDFDGSEMPAKDNSFARSRWFTRGWTLQELLAPREVVFFDRNWNEVGSKKSLRDVVSAITHIGTEALDERRFSEYSVAQKMSWAAGRQTTRPEDEAYCLMGLFDVNMPMIYGEGRKAFYRLQQEILKQSDDHSLFAWTHPPNDHSHTMMTGLLAPSPNHFKDAASIKQLRYSAGEKYENVFELVHHLVRINTLSAPQVEGLLLRESDDDLAAFHVAGSQQAGSVIQGTQDSASISDPPESQADRSTDNEPDDYMEYGEQQLVVPEIRIDLIEESNVLDQPVFRTYIGADNIEYRSDFESVPQMFKPLSEYHDPYSEDHEFSQPVKKPTGPANWRRYIYEPVVVVPLRCHVRGHRLGILLSKDATQGGEGIFSRLHNPSLVVMGPDLELRLSLNTVYGRIATRPREVPQGRVRDNQQWPEIRITSLLSAGYRLLSTAGPNWDLNQSQNALIPKTHYCAHSDAPLALFYNQSTGDSDAPPFFLSIPRNNLGSLTCEIGVFGGDSSASSSTGFYLYSCNLAEVRHGKVPLKNGYSLVVRYREGVGVNYVILSIDNREESVRSVMTMAPRENSETRWLVQRLFPLLRS
ncbi:vegetative incompatibility protein HET-E-1, partial [Echria macrotheca]